MFSETVTVPGVPAVAVAFSQPTLGVAVQVSGIPVETTLTFWLGGKAADPAASEKDKLSEPSMISLAENWLIIMLSVAMPVAALGEGRATRARLRGMRLPAAGAAAATGDPDESVTITVNVNGLELDTVGVPMTVPLVLRLKPVGSEDPGAREKV